MEKVNEANLLTMIDTLGAGPTLEMIYAQADKASVDAVNKSFRQGVEAARQRSDWWERVTNMGWTALLACAIVGIMLLASHWVQKDRAEFQRQIVICSSGQTVYCQKAVQDRSGPDKSSTNESRVLKSSFLVGTGKSLPELPQ